MTDDNNWLPIMSIANSRQTNLQLSFLDHNFFSLKIWTTWWMITKFHIFFIISTFKFCIWLRLPHLISTQIRSFLFVKEFILFCITVTHVRGEINCIWKISICHGESGNKSEGTVDKSNVQRSRKSETFNFPLNWNSMKQLDSDHKTWQTKLTIKVDR